MSPAAVELELVVKTDPSHQLLWSQICLQIWSSANNRKNSMAFGYHAQCWAESKCM